MYDVFHSNLVNQISMTLPLNNKNATKIGKCTRK